MCVQNAEVLTQKTKLSKVSLNIKEKIYTKGFGINKYIPVKNLWKALHKLFYGKHIVMQSYHSQLSEAA